MSDRDPIVDLFERKLKNAEFEVDPSVWTNIASQIPTATASVTGGGITLTSKLIIAASVIATVAVTSVSIYLFQNDEKDPDQILPVAVENIQNKKMNISSEESTDIINTNTSTQTEEKKEEEAISENKELETIAITEEVLTVRTVDRILEHDNLVEEDRLIKDVIDTQNIHVQIKEEETSSINTEEVVNTDEIIDNPSKAIEVKVPNVFTPNNDGQNDLYYVTFDGTINNVSVVIFNNLGEVVFRSSDANFKWDGRNMFGDQCPTGKYILIMTGEDQNGNEVLKNKDFQLLR